MNRSSHLQCYAPKTQMQSVQNKKKKSPDTEMIMPKKKNSKNVKWDVIK